ncbi:MAG: hypothetical protein AVDCRST_MAG93-9581, partial [uncultured Chloroflexia bacterium]
FSGTVARKRSLMWQEVGKSTEGEQMSAHGESPRHTASEAKVEGRAHWGTAACILGIVCAVSGAFFVDLMLEFLGILLGATGYTLGARKVGTATIVLSTILLLVFMAATQGAIPGVEPRDPLAL